MDYLIVTENPEDWRVLHPQVEIVTAKNYLTDSAFIERRSLRIINLCKSYKYQSLGYYVSLLAEARGHKPLPAISTIQDMRTISVIRYTSEELEDHCKRSFSNLTSEEYHLSVYFGYTNIKKYRHLASYLFSLFRSPFLRAKFRRVEDSWVLDSVKPIPSKDIPQEHWDLVKEKAQEFFAGDGLTPRKKWRKKYDLAILLNPKEVSPPSNEKAIQRFTKAAEDLGMEVEILNKEELGRLKEFDALFIRETTAINHHTYRFARRAQAEGLVVIDDPLSILRCTNKVYMAEVLNRHNITIPKTVILNPRQYRKDAERLGFPLVLKQPDSAFSAGVFKVNDAAELKATLQPLFEKSAFIIAQEYLYTPFDWRIGVCNKNLLYACKYHMSEGHWQIVRKDAKGKTVYGRVEPIPLDEVPPQVKEAGLKSANLIGDGIYGVDIKLIGEKAHVIEVNDNPNIDGGYEDAILKGELYTTIMKVFLERIEKRKKI